MTATMCWNRLGTCCCKARATSVVYISVFGWRLLCERNNVIACVGALLEPFTSFQTNCLAGASRANTTIGHFINLLGKRERCERNKAVSSVGVMLKQFESCNSIGLVGGSDATATM